jgi:hypothetical protein
MRRDYCQGTQRSSSWIGVYSGNPPSSHPCRPSTQRRQSITGGDRSLGSLADSARRASSWRGEAPGDHAYEGKYAGRRRRCRAGERQGPGDAPELSRISNKRPRSGGNLGLRVHGRQDRLAVHHASAFKNVESETTLSEEESIFLMLYEDP